MSCGFVIRHYDLSINRILRTIRISDRNWYRVLTRSLVNWWWNRQSTSSWINRYEWGITIINWIGSTFWGTIRKGWISRCRLTSWNSRVSVCWFIRLSLGLVVSRRLSPNRHNFIHWIRLGRRWGWCQFTRSWINRVCRRSCLRSVLTWGLNDFLTLF